MKKRHKKKALRKLRVVKIKNLRSVTDILLKHMKTPGRLELVNIYGSSNDNR